VVYPTTSIVRIFIRKTTIAVVKEGTLLHLMTGFFFV
jgi:hypothetical protein